MKILRMTATFGKLENQTLTLQPGLNVISAPNEWGKTTWCNFLATMLYGLDTREKTTKTTIAIKERYAPWSGAPMSGRMDLEWDGRQITIERWSKGRTPLGEFKAYETENGLPVPDLTGANCGEMLLGVEKSVFLRAGFLRLADLPVTADDALRRRLNALVTTGDESDAADTLGQTLKDLKNKCRSNRTNGLIPQAEAEKKALEEKQAQLRQLQAQIQALSDQQTTCKHTLSDLENHARWLEYAAVEENQRRIQDARDAARLARLQLQTQEDACRSLPTREALQQKLYDLQDLQRQQQNARLDAQMLPPPPQEPKAPLCFYGLSGEAALAQAEKDGAQYQSAATPARKPLPLWIPGVIGAVAGIALLILKLWIPGILLLMAGAGLAFAHILLAHKRSQASFAMRTKQQSIAARYGGGTPADWLTQARQYARQVQEYAVASQQHAAQRQKAQDAIAHLEQRLLDATDGMGLSAATAYYTDALRQLDALANAHRAFADAQNFAENMAAMEKPVEKPTAEDKLAFSPAQTQQMLEETRQRLHQLQQLQSQYQGRMDALGSEHVLQQALVAVNARLDRLTLYYNALDLAQQTLQKATDTLQRRFAPRITASARALFCQLTNGRYDQLHLTQDLTVDTATCEDISTRSILWRSDGTIDQLYLALRLAVAKELTPDAPLVLDDALVRFDDTRHALAMALLRQEAEHKQIILFTCQSRECTP